MSNAAQAISGMSISVTVDRFADGDFDDDGIATTPTSSPFTIIASVQPMRPDEKLMLPEGSRGRESIKLYTVSELKTMNEETKRPADVVNWESKKFDVFQVSRYKMGVQDHTKAIAIRQSL